jgi:NarL family two-component system response regulator LiaR
MLEERRSMTTPRLIRVMIVDDHPVAQAGVRYMLNALPDLELVGQASSGEEALFLYERMRPDVVLMDVMMPIMDGIATTERLKAREPGAKVLILTSISDGEVVQRALKAGATGYLLKTATALELAQAVRAAYHGRTTMAPEATQALIEAMRSTIGVDLTEREREVLVLMSDGMSNAQIGERLSVSPATVKFHISGIFSKLGVATRAAAIALAYKRKLV